MGVQKWGASSLENVNEELLAESRSAGIYSMPSLAPLHWVRQVEIEAGDCEGRLPLLFWTLNIELATYNFQRNIPA